MATETAVISARLDAVQRELSQLSTVMTTVSDSLTKLVKLETQHGYVLEQLREQDKRAELLAGRMAVVETEMPGLREMRRWVVVGVIGALALIGGALLKLVVYDVPRFTERVTTQPDSR